MITHCPLQILLTAVFFQRSRTDQVFVLVCVSVHLDELIDHKTQSVWSWPFSEVNFFGECKTGPRGAEPSSATLKTTLKSENNQCLSGKSQFIAARKFLLSA